MKKSILYILSLVVLVIMPINVLAKANLVITCPTETLTKEKNVECNIKVNSEEEIGSLAVKIKVPKGIEVESIYRYEPWLGNAEGNAIMAYVDENVKGEIDLANFTLKTDGKYDGTAKIELVEASYSNKDYETVDFDNVSEEIEVEGANGIITNSNIPIVPIVVGIVLVAIIIVIIIKKKKK